MPRPNRPLNLEFFPETLAPCDLTKPATDASKVKSLCLVLWTRSTYLCRDYPYFCGASGL